MKFSVKGCLLLLLCVFLSSCRGLPGPKGGGGGPKADFSESPRYEEVSRLLEGIEKDGIADVEKERRLEEFLDFLTEEFDKNIDEDNYIEALGYFRSLEAFEKTDVLKPWNEDLLREAYGNQLLEKGYAAAAAVAGVG